MDIEKKILLFSTLTLIVTMSSLAWIERGQSDFDNGKNWWAISFTNPSPENSNLDFIIENFSNSEEFVYQIITEQSDSLKQVLTIPKGTSKEITTTQKPPAQIRVTTGDQTKTINK